MIEKLKYLLAGSLLLAAAGGFVACDDDETTLDEWESTYVYVKGATLGNEETKSYKVVETVGLPSDATPLTYSFQVCLNKPAAEAVSVAMEMTKSGNVEDVLDDTVVADAYQITVPAGRLESDPVTVTIDPSFLGIKDAQGTYEDAVFVFAIKSLVAAPKDVKISTKTNKVTLSLSKTVSAYLNMATGQASGTQMDRSAWSGSLGSGVEGSISNLWDGSSSDIASNSAPWEFTIDLGQIVTVSGVRTNHWGSYYAPRSIEIFTSTDNATWKSQGVLAVSGNPQNWHFLTPVSMRYMRYVALSPNSRTDITEFNVYIAE